MPTKCQSTASQEQYAGLRLINLFPLLPLEYEQYDIAIV